jgi:hypothetical protein
LTAKKFVAALLALGMHTLPAHAAGAKVEGHWAGDQLQLVIDAKGGHIETGCASGEITGPIKLAEDGSFAALGTFQIHHGGPQHAADAAVAVAAPAARFRGAVKAGSMRLEILPAGAVAPEVFNLRAGARIKLIRCL